MTRPYLDAGVAALRGLPVAADAPAPDRSPLDQLLDACPADVREWAERVLELPPGARVARAVEALLGLPVALSDGPE